MMGDDIIDPELRDKLIETHTDMKHVRRMIEQQDAELEELRHQHDSKIEDLRMQHDDRIEELRNLHDERLLDLERTQSKIMAYIIAVGAVITVAVNAAIQIGTYVLEKIWR